MTATSPRHRNVASDDGWQHEGPAWRHVLFATDGMPGSLTAAERALDTARTDGGTLTLLVVRPVEEDPSVEDRAPYRLPETCRSVLDRAASLGVNAALVVRHGPPGQDDRGCRQRAERLGHRPEPAWVASRRRPSHGHLWLRPDPLRSPGARDPALVAARTRRGVTARPLGDAL